MSAMGPHFSRRILVILITGIMLLGLAGRTTHAGKKDTYYFLLYDIELASGIPPAIKDMVRTEITKAIAAHERLIEVLPADAPDPSTDPDAFNRYIKKHKIQPYHVDVEVTEYRHEVEELPAPRRGQRLTVSIALRTLGETMPKRWMAFSGDGAATIKMDIGKRLRERDTQVANRDAIVQAVGDALTTSLAKLDAKDTKKKPARKKK